MQIYTKGEGLVEFNSLDEMEHVIKKLDDTKFNGDYIRLTVRRFDDFIGCSFLSRSFHWSFVLSR